MVIMTAMESKLTYRAPRPIAKLAGVCGWPIHHSLSPLMHNYWIRETGLKGAYVHFAVRPDEAFRAFRSLKHTSISGVNVTLPLKKTAFEAADIHSSSAKRLGVANCLYKEDGKLIAHNTDLEGFAVPLIKLVGADRITNTPAFVIGTGGAAQAVLHTLIDYGCPEIRLCGRTDEKAAAIVDDISIPSLYTVSWANRHQALIGAGLIINASAGGMRGKPELDINLAAAHPGTCVYDLIYTPQETGLLKQARALGLMTLGGLDMLIAQAKPSFELFYGVPVPDTADPKPLLIKALKSA